MQRKLAVNLVRHDAHVMLAAQLGNACKLMSSPYTSAGVMRIAQNKETGTLVRQLTFEIIEVDIVVHILLIIYNKRV